MIVEDYVVTIRKKSIKNNNKTPKLIIIVYISTVVWSDFV